MERNTKSRTVAIIGGGISGLVAARELYNSRECDVVVLEAEDRLGGRIHSVSFHDEIIDLGAQWVHGTVGNSVYQLVEDEIDDSSIVKRYTPANGYNVLMESGFPISDAVRKMFDSIPEMFSLLEEECNRIIEDLGSSEDSVMKRSPQELFDEIWTRRVGEEMEDTKDDISAIKAVRKSTLQLMCEADVVDSLSQVNLYQYYTYRELDGPDYIIPRGFMTVIDKLIDGLPTSIFKLNCAVKCIHWNANSNGLKTRNKPVLVKYTDDEGNQRSIEADHILVTVSLGCLKYHHETLFMPSLPEYKRMAIEYLGYGHDGKIFLYYKKPFWKPGEFPLYILWDVFKDENDNPDPDHNWVRSIRQFSPWKDSCHILFSWMFGSNVEIVRKLTARDVGRKMTEVLRRFKKDESIPEPDDIKVSDWSENPNFHGSYSYMSLGSSGKDIQNLAEPLRVNGVPRVLFSGEATHQNFYSTTHGAYDSGMREAKRILES